VLQFPLKSGCIQGLHFAHLIVPVRLALLKLWLHNAHYVGYLWPILGGLVLFKLVSIPFLCLPSSCNVLLHAQTFDSEHILEGAIHTLLIV